MKTLLGIEWLKIKRYRTFWVLTGFFILLLPLWNFEIYNGVIRMGGKGVNLLSQAYSFPAVWSNYGFWGSIFVLFLSILIITITCNEYTFRTHRQNVIDGWSRLKFFHGKVALVLALSLAATLYLFIAGGLMGAIASGSFSEILSSFSEVGFFFLLVLNYLGFALFIALWIRRSGLAISLFLLYSLIIETILSATINHYSGTKYGNLLPLQASDELLPFPMMRMAASMMAPSTQLPNTLYAGVTLLWCALYYFGGRAILLKKDL